MSCSDECKFMKRTSGPKLGFVHPVVKHVH